jgi:hypothetical protein
MTLRIHKALLGLVAIAPLLPLACSSGDSKSDAGADGGKDATVADVRQDTTTDAPKDTQQDTGPANDGGITDAADASDAADSAGEAGDGGTSFVPPTCDGVIGTNEYGGSSYQTTSGSQTWYMTWDATNLYVALDTATLTEASVLYVGYSGFGLTTAQVYDNTGGTLPFQADGVVYAKSGYQESRIGSVDAGTSWGAANTSSVMFCGSGTTRELVIPWTALHTSTIPNGFDFLAYATSSGGFVYGQIPTSNVAGNIGTDAGFAHFYAVGPIDAGALPFANVQ